MPRTQQQQADSRGRWSSCLLPLLLLAGALSSRPSHAAIHIPSTCEYTHTNRHTLVPGRDGRWPNAGTGGFKDVFVVLMAAAIIKGCY